MTTYIFEVWVCVNQREQKSKLITQSAQMSICKWQHQDLDTHLANVPLNFLYYNKNESLVWAFEL
jgi:hypothetical protein